MHKRILFLLIPGALVVFGGVFLWWRISPNVPTVVDDVSVSETVPATNAYIYNNTASPPFTLTFTVPVGYTVVGPCLTDACAKRNPMLVLYKKGTEPNQETFENNAAAGFVGGDVWIEWYDGKREIASLIDTKQVPIAKGQTKTYGEHAGTEFVRVGQGSVSLFIFEASGYTFVVTDANPNRNASFPLETWEALLSSVTIQSEGVVDITQDIKTEQEFLSASIDCSDDLSCFMEGIEKNTWTRYSGIIEKEPFVGVHVAAQQTLMVSAVPTGGYTLVATTTSPTVDFAEGWLDLFLVRDDVPVAVRQQLEEAAELTEEEVAHMSPKMQEMYQQLMVSGKTPEEVAKELAAWQLEQYVQSMISLGAMTQTCALNDLTELQTVLKQWEQGGISADDINFSTCKSSPF